MTFTAGIMTETVAELFADFLALPPNWDSYGGDPISPKAVESARAFHALLEREEGPPVPFIAPVCDGGVQFEFEGEGWWLTLGFEADGHPDWYCEDNRPGRAMVGGGEYTDPECIIGYLREMNS